MMYKRGWTHESMEAMSGQTLHQHFLFLAHGVHCITETNESLLIRPISHLFSRASHVLNPPIMKPVVSAMKAWSCTVMSVFAIIILTVLGVLFRSGHEELVGGIDDPADGKAVSKTVFSAVFVYIAFFVFCGLQGLLHIRENRRGAISL
ncbi:hypothetical protein TgHK011_003045 [Trichoderma gracile]|nr:hypothetical protein TgHK011_003045 [Trichoderma gracile]